MTVKELKRIRVLAIVGIIIVFVLLILALGYGKETLKVYFFDVGQGDASLLVFPGNIQVLIDGGPDRGILRKVGRAMPFYDHKIEYVILTHPHSDHLTGVVDALDRYNVSTFISNGVSRDDLPPYQKLTTLIKDKNIRTVVIDYPSALEIGGGRIEFLYPDHKLDGEERTDFNTGSVVLRVVYGESEFLFTGDMPRSVEDRLIEKGVDVSSDVLKVAHQGSKTSSGETFISEVHPDYAVIMVGENTYGHPHTRTLLTLERKKIRVIRTDKAGDIVFNTDGRLLKLKGNPIIEAFSRLHLKKFLTVLE